MSAGKKKKKKRKPERKKEAKDQRQLSIELKERENALSSTRKRWGEQKSW